MNTDRKVVPSVPSALDFSDLKKVLDRITSRLVESSDPGALFDAVVQIAMDTCLSPKGYWQPNSNAVARNPSHYWA